MDERNVDSDETETDRFDKPVLEVKGTTSAIERFGSPSEYGGAERLRYVFYPTWRSQLIPLVGYLACCFFSVWLSNIVPGSVIQGRLFAIGDSIYSLHLPLFSFVPGFLIGKVLLYIYDSKYIIDDGGVEAQIGLVSMHLRQPRLRWEDIRGVEPNQSLWERILGIGSVLVGSAMTQDVEIVMEGVDNPRAIQLLISGERDRRLKHLASSGRSAAMLHVQGD